MHGSCAYSHFVNNFLNRYMTVFHEYLPNLLNRIPVSTCGWPVWACLTLHWGSAMFDAVAPLLDLSFAHGTIAESSGWFEIEYHQTFGKTWCDMSAQCVWSACVKMKTWWACTTYLYSSRNSQGLMLLTAAKVFMYAWEG